MSKQVTMSKREGVYYCPKCGSSVTWFDFSVIKFRCTRCNCMFNVQECQEALTKAMHGVENNKEKESVK